MKTTITTLLRDFPRVRKAAMAGETVWIVSKEATFRFELERNAERPLIGGLKGQLKFAADDLHKPTSTDAEWTG